MLCRYLLASCFFQSSLTECPQSQSLIPRLHSTPLLTWLGPLAKLMANGGRLAIFKRRLAIVIAISVSCFEVASFSTCHRIIVFLDLNEWLKIDNIRIFQFKL